MADATEHFPTLMAALADQLPARCGGDWDVEALDVDDPEVAGIHIEQHSTGWATNLVLTPNARDSDPGWILWALDRVTTSFMRAKAKLN